MNSHRAICNLLYIDNILTIARVEVEISYNSTNKHHSNAL